MKLDHQTFNKWKTWCKTIEDDLMQLLDDKQIYESFIEMANANFGHIETNEGWLFCDFVQKCYGVQAAVGIRRHVKVDDDSISLMKLLKQIETCAEQFTYDFYLECYPPDESHPIGRGVWQKLTFGKFSDNGKVISKKKIQDNIQELSLIGEKVTVFVDRGIAHLDKRGTENTVTYNDLSDCLDILNKIACKYIGLLTAEGYASLKPVIQFNWEKIFTVPLDAKRSSYDKALVEDM